jgi:hypothetical protein
LNIIQLWQDGNYHISGKFAATAVELIGLAPPTTDYELTNDRDPFAPAKFTAGWYYGISGDDRRHEII